MGVQDALLQLRGLYVLPCAVERRDIRRREAPLVRLDHGRVLRPQRDHEPQLDQARELLLARRAGDPGRECHHDLRGLDDQARHVRPPAGASARAPPQERVCGVAPVETYQAVLVVRRTPTHVRDTSERARLHLEVRVAARPRDPLVGLLVSARGPVRLLALARAVDGVAARTAPGRVGLIDAARAGGSSLCVSDIATFQKGFEVR